MSVSLHDGRSLEVDQLDGRHRKAAQPTVGADELGDEIIGRGAQHAGRGVVLSEPAALLEDGDPVAEADGLLDVVGDEDDGLGQPGLDVEELVLKATADDRIDRAERLVHQQDVGVGSQRPGYADALALSAGELVRVAVGEGARLEPHRVEQLLDPGVGALLVPAEQLGHGGDVGADGLVREQPDLLDDVADPAAQLDGVHRG